MPAQRVIPRGSKARQNYTVWLQEFRHRCENGCRIREVLKGIDRRDHVCQFIGVLYESQILALHAACLGTRDSEPTVLDVYPVDVSRTILGYFDRLRSRPA